MNRTNFSSLTKISLLCLFAAVPVFASRPSIVDNEVVAKLKRGAAPGEKLVVSRVPLFGGNPGTLTLERFEVWAPDVQIIEYGAGGKERRLARPVTKFYRGRIEEDPGSLVFVSVHPSGEISGMALAGDGLRKLSIGRGVRRDSVLRRDREDLDRAAPLLSREFDEMDDLLTTPGGGFHCDVEKASMSIASSLSARKPKAESNTAPSTSIAYGLNLAIETDFELFQGFGSSSSALTMYIGNLIGQASVIYQRDLKTTLSVGTTHIYTTVSDPWTVLPASGTGAALAELGNYWHANFLGVSRSSVVMLSGKQFNGGVAWINQLCKADFSCGAGGCGSPDFVNSFGGGYAFCGSTVVTTTVPDPTLTLNTVQFALPNNNNFWMLLEVTHELGHNANGDHTHCISTASTAYSAVRPFVDLCFNGEGTGCYGGVQSYPTELGTIMSYCHNLNTTLNNPPGAAAGFPASRYIFGKVGEPSELVFPFFTTGLESATPNGAITVGASLPCTAGQTASVANANALAWQITGGTITSATNIAAITFTPTAPSVTLSVTATNVAGCSITSQRITTSQCAGIAPPTNVAAAATSTSAVTVSWTAASGATSYQVFRATAFAGPYVQIGTSATTSYPDSTGLSASTTYLYKVRSVNAVASVSGDSNIDPATTVIFTNDPIVSASTSVRQAHLTELRTAVNAMRVAASLGAFSFTDAVTGTLPVKALHVTELRTKLDAARVVFGLPAISYTDPTLTIASTLVKATHFQQLRNGTK